MVSTLWMLAQTLGPSFEERRKLYCWRPPRPTSSVRVRESFLEEFLQSGVTVISERFVLTLRNSKVSAKHQDQSSVPAVKRLASHRSAHEGTTAKHGVGRSPSSCQQYRFNTLWLPSFFGAPPWRVHYGGACFPGRRPTETQHEWRFATFRQQQRAVRHPGRDVWKVT